MYGDPYKFLWGILRKFYKKTIDLGLFFFFFTYGFEDVYDSAPLWRQYQYCLELRVNFENWGRAVIQGR